MNDEPERLLAEALRAQAGRAGTDVAGIGNTSAHTNDMANDRASDNSLTALVPVRWLLFVAALLGLATGTVIGLLTLL